MLAAFFLISFFSEGIGTVVGFGSSTILLPLSLFFFNFTTALVLVAFFHLFGNLSRVGLFRGELDKNIVVKFGIPSVIFSILGALLVKYVSQDLLKGILGLFLFVYSGAFLWKENIKIKVNIFNILLGGSISGFLAGLIGTGGALRGAFLSSFRLPKEKYIATSAFIAIIVDATRIPAYLREGFLQSSYNWYLLVLFPVAIMGSFLGKKIVEKIPQKSFRKVILVAILLMSLQFIYIGLIKH